MKIEIQNNGTKEYYEEFLYIIQKYKRINKNPRKKVHSIINMLIVEIILIILLLTISSFIFINYRIYPVIVGTTGVLLFIFLFSLYSYKRKVKEFMTCNETKVLKINKDCVEYFSDKITIKQKWENIKYVIINKHSIVFFPYNMNEIFISISISYKKDIIKAIKKYAKESKLIDNNK